MVMESHKLYSAMIFVQLVYAGLALLSKEALALGMNPHAFVFYRQAFASVVLVPFFVFFERESGSAISFGLLCQIFMVSFCGVTLSLNLYYIALDHTSATFAAATCNAIPAITCVLSLIFRMESVSFKKLHGIAKMAGSALGLSGAFVFAFLKGPPLKIAKWHPEIENHSSNKNSVQGSLLMLLTNVVWSLWLILQKYPPKLRLTTMQCWFSCIQTAVWAAAVERRPSAWKLGWNLNLLSVAYCGLIVTGITHWLQVWSVVKKGPVFTAMFTPLSLIITAFFSAIFWKEALQWGSFGGGVLLVMELYGVLWGKKKEEMKKDGNKEEEAEAREDIHLECITHH